MEVKGWVTFYDFLQWPLNLILKFFQFWFETNLMRLCSVFSLLFSFMFLRKVFKKANYNKNMLLFQNMQKYAFIAKYAKVWNNYKKYKNIYVYFFERLF